MTPGFRHLDHSANLIRQLWRITPSSLGHDVIRKHVVTNERKDRHGEDDWRDGQCKEDQEPNVYIRMSGDVSADEQDPRGERGDDVWNNVEKKEKNFEGDRRRGW